MRLKVTQRHRRILARNYMGNFLRRVFQAASSRLKLSSLVYYRCFYDAGFLPSYAFPVLDPLSPFDTIYPGNFSIATITKKCALISTDPGPSHSILAWFKLTATEMSLSIWGNQIVLSVHSISFVYRKAKSIGGEIGTGNCLNKCDKYRNPFIIFSLWSVRFLKCVGLKFVL